MLNPNRHNLPNPSDITKEIGLDQHWELTKRAQRIIKRYAADPSDITRGRVHLYPAILKTAASISTDTNDWTSTEYHIRPDELPFPITRVVVSPCHGVNVLLNVGDLATQRRVGTQWYPQSQLYVASDFSPQELCVPRAIYPITVSVWNAANATANQSYPIMITFIDDGAPYVSNGSHGGGSAGGGN